MLTAIASFAVLGLILGGGLSLASHYLAVDSDPLADELEDMLPNLQCGQCSYPGCRPAAEALSAGEAEVTLCPPGGMALAERLAEKLQLDVDLSALEHQVPKVAFIVEDLCIGCTKCIAVCPTGCIVGGAKKMHTVIAWACLGDNHCVEVCPTAAIDMIPMPEKDVSIRTWHWPKPTSPQIAAGSSSASQKEAA